MVQTNGQVKLTQALVAPQAIVLIQNAYKAERTIDYNIQQARRDILFGVAQLYYGVASLQELSAVQERQVVLTKERERDSRVRFEAGTGHQGRPAPRRDRPGPGRGGPQAGPDRLPAGPAGAGHRPRPPRRLRHRHPRPSPPQPTGTNLEQQALDLRPDVKAAAENLDLAQGERTRIYMQYLPSIGGLRGLQLREHEHLQPQRLLLAGRARAHLDPPRRRPARGLHPRGRRPRSPRPTRCKRLVDLKAVDRVKEAQLDLQGAVANRAKARERTGLAQENARLVDVAYKAGAATYLESTDSVQTLRQAEVGLVAESLNVDLATLKLLNAVGAFEEVNN